MDTQNSMTQFRLRLKISHDYYQEPIISNLIQKFQIQVNIRAAFLGAEQTSDGWFDLELIGEQPSINLALEYLKGLHLEMWIGEDQLSW